MSVVVMAVGPWTVSLRSRTDERRATDKRPLPAQPRHSIAISRRSAFDTLSSRSGALMEVAFAPKPDPQTVVLSLPHTTRSRPGTRPDNLGGPTRWVYLAQPKGDHLYVVIRGSFEPPFGERYTAAGSTRDTARPCRRGDRMNRRDLIVLLAGAALSRPLPVAAQGAARVPHINLLMAGTPAIEAARLAAFRDALKRLRYTEGETIVIEPHYAEGVPDRLMQMAREVVDRKPNVIVCVGGQEARALLAVTRSIPIVFMQSGDAVEQGLVPNYARPGGNITGFTQMSDELDSKRLELLRVIAPSLSRAAVLTDSRLAAPGRIEKSFAAAETAAKLLGIILLRHDATTAAELTTALAAIEASGSQALLVPNDPLYSAERPRILEFAAARRLPTVFQQRVAVAEGGLLGYGPDLLENARLAAGYVDKILKGAKPAELPVQQPTKFELTVNLETAKALGLTVPQSLLARADEVIE